MPDVECTDDTSTLLIPRRARRIEPRQDKTTSASADECFAMRANREDDDARFDVMIVLCARHNHDAGVVFTRAKRSETLCSERNRTESESMRA